MKKPTTPSTLGACVRLAALLTTVVGMVTLLIVPFQRGPEAIAVAAALFGAFTLVIWCSSLFIGLLCILSESVWRLVRQGGYDKPGMGLGDEWMDGPGLKS